MQVSFYSILVKHFITTTTNLYVSKSCYHHICNSLFTDRLVQILDFGEVSPRQASAFESNSKGFE